jgi:hypothetical protein
MLQKIDPEKDYYGEAIEPNELDLTGRRDIASVFNGRNRELRDKYKEHDATSEEYHKMVDIDVPGSFLVGGTLPCTKNDGKVLIRNINDALAYVTKRYGKALVKWVAGKPEIVRPGVLWNAKDGGSAVDPFWTFRVSTQTSIDNAKAKDGQSTDV